MIEFQKLLYFIAIVDCNFSLSAASKKLSITQPTLSLTIEQLERHFNVKLLEKEKNKYVRLTTAGQLLYDDSKIMVEQSNQTYIKITNIQDYTGEVKIALPPVTQPVVCSQVIADFKKQYPNIKLTIYEEGAFIGKQRLISKELDFGFLTVFETDNILDGFLIYESDLVAVFKKDHPLSELDEVSATDIEKYDMVGFDTTFNLNRMVNVYFNSHNAQINYFHNTSRWDFALEMVAKTDYQLVSIMPFPILKMYRNDNMTYKKFKDPFKWKVTLSYHKDRVMRKECILFRDFIKQHFNIQ